MTIAISIIITSYNRERFLGAAIESVLAQTRGDFELLIWDDGSTDRSVEIAQHYAKQDKRVQVIAAEHLGRTRALKYAIAQSHGTYLGIVDSDDLLAPTALQETAQVLEQEADVGMVYTSYLDIGEQNAIVSYGYRCLVPYSKERLLHQFMTFHFRLMRRSVYEQVGGFRESFDSAEDYDLCLRLSEITEIQHLNQPLYYYRTHPESISHQQRTQQILAAQLAVEQAYQRRGHIKSPAKLSLAGTKETHQGNSIGYKKCSQRWKIGATVASLLPFTLCLLPSLVAAQPISDSTTNTQVTPNGNLYNISGGELSGNGENLFHSFSQFGLNQDQIANFLSNPSILNILGRVTGGNASLIDGVIQVSGGNSNLFLMNPAGIVFGSNAQLNVPASFTATTATGIGLDNSWFKVLGTNDYNSFVGTPNAFQFATSQAGAIVNSGNLTIPTGGSLTLIGGTVVSTGSVQATSGNITITSVPGSSELRLSQAGQILSLDVNLPTNGDGSLSSITPLMLPQLLTGNAANLVTGITVNDSGTQLTNSGVVIAAGDVVTNQLNSGTATLSAQNNLTLIESNLVTTGDMNLLAQNTVFVRDSIANPFLAQAGGNLYIQGIQGVNILALNHLTQKAFISGGDLSLVSDGIISGDAHYVSGGRFSVLNLSGGGGDFVSYFDPIISSTEDVVFGSYTGVSLKVETLGSITVTGDITITGADFNLAGFCSGTGTPIGSKQPVQQIAHQKSTAKSSSLLKSNTQPDSDYLLSQAAPCSDDAIALGTEPTLILRAGLAELEEINFDYPDTNFAEVPPDSPAFGSSGTVFSATGETSTPGNVTVTGDINVGAFRDFYGNVVNLYGGPVIITASGDIETGDINTFATVATFANDNGVAQGGDVLLQTVGNISTGVINTSADIANNQAVAQAGQVNIEAGGNILFDSINAQGINDNDDGRSGEGTGGNVSILTSNGVVQGIGTLAGNTINTQGTTQGGSVAIRHDGGLDNVPFIVGNADINGTAGAITTGAVTLDGDEFPTPGEETRGDTPDLDGVLIDFVNTEPTLTATPQLPDVQQDQSITFTFEDLATVVADANGDNTSIVLDAVTTGTLTRNGIPLAPGDTILPGDILVYTPPADSTGQLDAFSIVASDVVSLSTPQQISIAVLPTDTPTDPPNDPPPTDPPIDQPDLPQDNPPPEETPVPKLPLLGDISDLPPVEIDPVVSQLEESFTHQFEQYFGQPTQTPITSLDEGREILNEIEKATGIKPAMLYVTFVPQTISSFSQSTQSPDNLLPQNNDQLELVMVTAKGTPVRKRVTGATREQVLKIAQDFRGQITNVRRTNGYLASAQQLYQWLVAPLESDLQTREIQNVVFLMDAGLRSVPVAALHDGKGFLIERYSVGLMPSLSLTDTRYKDIKESQVLAMGATKFTDQEPLPAVPVEVSTIVNQLWQGKSFLENAFTLENLKRSRQQQPFGIIHLATHGDFQAGDVSNSYIQLWDTKLRLNQLRQLGWNNPPVELLVLSACRTALGNEQAELGFAGLSVLAGVKSSLASLWSVNDQGTLALMTEFYEQLKSAPIKAEALRQAQLAMLRKEVRLERGQLRVLNTEISLPPELAELADQTLEHPYYWSAFTMIGNPW